MCRAMRHRGPDDEGIFVGPGVALGMRRLSIIDLPSGHQPLSNEDGTVWVVFNGEIYNFQQLRRDLESRGHIFATRTDTETIVHLYEEFGADLVSHLRGMFGIAVWDGRERRLLVARDRLGIKPLYYSEHNGHLLFASELKAILTVRGCDARLDWPAVNSLFTCLTTPPDQSIVAGIRKLEPAHVLTAACGAPVQSRRYWDLHFEPNLRATPEELVDRLRHELDESVRLHMVSDVPTGAFLSGGIDSSAVVACMAQHTAQPIRTFSIGFAAAPFNELPHARVVARRFATEHHELVLQPDVVDLLDDIVWHLDEPFGDSSAIPTYMVSRLAAEHVTVVLSGDGGDELFGGYDKYRVEQREREGLRLPAAARVALRFIGRVMPDSMKGKNFASHHALDGWARYLDASTLFRTEAKKKLFRPDVFRQLAAHDPWSAAETVLARQQCHWLSAAQYVDLHRYLPLDILTKVDRMSMAHALEARVPLLDHVLVELAASIPPALLLQNGSGKHVFKRALRGLLPDATLTRGKQGFAIPLGDWFRGELEPVARELLLSPRSRQRDLFDPDYVNQLLERHERGRPLDLQVWTLICFEVWCRLFLDQRAWARDPRPPVRDRAASMQAAALATH